MEITNANKSRDIISERKEELSRFFHGEDVTVESRDWRRSLTLEETRLVKEWTREIIKDGIKNLQNLESQIAERKDYLQQIEQADSQGEMNSEHANYDVNAAYQQNIPEDKTWKGEVLSSLQLQYPGILDWLKGIEEWTWWTSEDLLDRIASDLTARGLQPTERLIENITKIYYEEGMDFDLDHILKIPENMEEFFNGEGTSPRLGGLAFDIILDCKKQELVQIEKSIIDKQNYNASPEIVKDIQKSGFQATKSLIKYIRRLDELSGKTNSMRDICKAYLSGCAGMSQEQKDTIEQIAKECREQELARIQLPER